MVEPTRDPSEVPSFAQFLQIVQDGQLHADLTEELKNAVAEMNNARQDGVAKPKAKITITVDLELEGQVVHVHADYKAALPKATRERSMFWTTDRNTLTRSNPKQQEMFPRRVVDAPAAEVRNVSEPGSAAPRTVG